MQPNQFLLYGANGYTGQLIAALSGTYKLQPILAGRNEVAVKALAAELGLPYQVFDLEDTARLHEVLATVPLVLHAAGPFQQTARQMITACIATNTHYIDITGEIPVFEMAKTYHQQAVDGAIMIMPGVGFDVVPTDCMALFLKNKLPDAVSLQLAFVSMGGGLSRGTATTMVMSLGEGGAVREEGIIVTRPLGHKGMWIDFSEVNNNPKPYFVMTIPWGDISTAFHTTGIPNIETYTGIKPLVFHLLKMQQGFNWLLKTALVKKFALKKINQQPTGPSSVKRAAASSMVWGKAQNVAGNSVWASMRVKDGYTLTAHSSLCIAHKILSGNLTPGFQTPAGQYGEDLILEIPETRRTPAHYR